MPRRWSSTVDVLRPRPARHAAAAERRRRSCARAGTRARSSRPASVSSVARRRRCARLPGGRRDGTARGASSTAAAARGAVLLFVLLATLLHLLDRPARHPRRLDHRRRAVLPGDDAEPAPGRRPRPAPAVRDASPTARSSTTPSLWQQADPADATAACSARTSPGSRCCSSPASPSAACGRAGPDAADRRRRRSRSRSSSSRARRATAGSAGSRRRSSRSPPPPSSTPPRSTRRCPRRSASCSRCSCCARRRGRGASRRSRWRWCRRWPGWHEVRAARPRDRGVRPLARRRERARVVRRPRRRVSGGRLRRLAPRDVRRADAVPDATWSTRARRRQLSSARTSASRTASTGSGGCSSTGASASGAGRRSSSRSCRRCRCWRALRERAARRQRSSVTQMLVATFCRVTMMGWWFPGRMLIVVLPLFAFVLTVRADPRCRGPRGSWRRSRAATRCSSRSLLVGRSRSGEVVLAVDPFAMSAWPFQALDGAFPQYTWWSKETIVLNAAWLVALLGATALVVRATYRLERPRAFLRGSKPGAPRATGAGWRPVRSRPHVGRGASRPGGRGRRPGSTVGA